MIKSLLEYLPLMKKALVPVVVGVALKALELVNITGEMSVREAVVLGVTGVFVWFVANTKSWLSNK